MDTSLIIGEGFLEDPYLTRQFALSQEPRTEVYQEELWTGIIPDWGTFPTDRLSDFMGFPVQPVLSFFHLFDNNEKEARIHADIATIGAEWAGVIYLCTPEQEVTMNCGTAIWRHIKTGLEGRITGLEEIYDKIEEDGFDKDNWLLMGHAAMKNNRIAVYPANLFHSRYPLEMEFGDTDEEKRLIWVVFFKRVE